MIPTYLRFPDLKKKKIVNSRVQLDKLIRDQGFPPGYWLSANVLAWAEPEVEVWLKTRPRKVERSASQLEGYKRGGKRAQEVLAAKRAARESAEA